MLLTYVSHGAYSAGGHRHELFFANSIAQSLRFAGKEAELQILRAERNFRGPAEWMQLLGWCFISSQGDAVITTKLGAMPALLRQKLNPKKTLLIVMHYFDKRDWQGAAFKTYMAALIKYLRFAKPKKVGVVAVSPFYQKLFRRLLPGTAVFLFPNLFSAAEYVPYSTQSKSKDVILGQYSRKNDMDALVELSSRLRAADYNPVAFNIQTGDAHSPHFEIKRFASKASYLQAMARATATIAFPAVNEGWPRMVHESLLVNTPVIGYHKGGLGDLLHEGNGYFAHSPQMAFEMIESGIKANTPEAFRQKYDTSQAEKFNEPIIDFILSNCPR